MRWAFEILKVIARGLFLQVIQKPNRAAEVFDQKILRPEITSRMKAGPPSVPRSRNRVLLTVLGTTFPHKDPETRNKGSSSHVAKAVCHGNIREGLVGRLLQLLRAWF